MKQNIANPLPLFTANNLVKYLQNQHPNLTESEVEIVKTLHPESDLKLDEIVNIARKL